MIDYLTLDDVLAAAEAHLGHPAEVGDYGLLESAVARPQATVFGEDAYPTIHEKAAALLQSLAANHPLLDGNERTAFVATALFYGLNGHHVPGSAEDELFDLVIAVATGGLDTVSKIAKRLSFIVG
ncbi:MAG: type II toxin-antitoxin system death-on-curing family toxin [Actinomycetota bacterium]|nr:type II toxin-antitoxin system death-on-curing family toxin [Actinomycetota bacterium]MDA2948388.1 type II toxin-antitoxin system death-on-curing family toxin [Actinomycetota bacterium]